MSKTYQDLISERATIQAKIKKYGEISTGLNAKKTTLLEYQESFKTEKTKITNFDLSCTGTWSGTKRTKADDKKIELDSAISTYSTQLETLVADIKAAIANADGIVYKQGLNLLDVNNQIIKIK